VPSFLLFPQSLTSVSTGNLPLQTTLSLDSLYKINNGKIDSKDYTLTRWLSHGTHELIVLDLELDFQLNRPVLLEKTILLQHSL